MSAPLNNYVHCVAKRGKEGRGGVEGSKVAINRVIGSMGIVRSNVNNVVALRRETIVAHDWRDEWKTWKMEKWAEDGIVAERTRKRRNLPVKTFAFTSFAPFPSILRPLPLSRRTTNT